MCHFIGPDDGVTLANPVGEAREVVGENKDWGVAAPVRACRVRQACSRSMDYSDGGIAIIQRAR